MEKFGWDTGGDSEDRKDRKWEYFERDSDSKTCSAVLSEEKVACPPMSTSVCASLKPKEQEKNKLCPFCQMKTEDFNFHLRVHDSCAVMHQMKVVLEAKIQSREKELEATKLELSAEKEKYEKTLKEEIERHKEEILKHSKKEVDMQDLIFRYEYELAQTKKRLADEQRKQKKNLKKYINVLKEFHLKHRQILKAEGHDIDQGVPIETQTKGTQTDPDFVSSTEKEHEIKDDTRPDEAFARGEKRAAGENVEKLKRMMEKELQQEGKPKEDLDIPSDDSQEDKRSHSRSNSRSSSRSNSRSCSWSRSRSRSRSLSWYEEYDSDTKQGNASDDDDNGDDDDDDDNGGCGGLACSLHSSHRLRQQGSRLVSWNPQ